MLSLPISGFSCFSCRELLCLQVDTEVKVMAQYKKGGASPVLDGITVVFENDEPQEEGRDVTDKNGQAAMGCQRRPSHYP